VLCSQPLTPDEAAPGVTNHFRHEHRHLSLLPIILWPALQQFQKQFLQQIVSISIQKFAATKPLVDRSTSQLA